MPLKTIPRNATKAQKRKIIQQNIAAEMKAGKSQKQAQAIALGKARQETKRRGYKKK